VISVEKKFVAERFTGTLGTSNRDGEPRLATVYYIFDGQRSLVFKSRSSSEHIKNVFRSPSAAFSVYDHASNYTIKSGIQLIGKISRISDQTTMKKLVKAYGQKFEGADKKFDPVALLVRKEAESTLFCFEIKSFKFTSTQNSRADMEYLEWH